MRRNIWHMRKDMYLDMRGVYKLGFRKILSYMKRPLDSREILHMLEVWGIRF